MKSQLIVQDFGGVHNKDIALTRTKIIKGATWKKQRIVVIIPSSDMIPAQCALSLWNMIFPPNNGVVRILALGCEVGDAYSKAIEQILEHPELKNWEYILTVEHDNLPPQDGILKLLETMDEHPEISCVSGLYFTKGEGGCAQIWGDPKDPVLNYRPQPPVDGKVVECCGTGMGFGLWRMKMFKDDRIKKPWFQTKAGKEGVGTQDLAFWGEARKYGYRCAVDCRVKVGHLDPQTGIIW